MSEASKILQRRLLTPANPPDSASSARVRQAVRSVVTESGVWKDVGTDAPGRKVVRDSQAGGPKPAKK